MIFRRSKRHACRTCGQDLVPDTIGRLEGRHREVTVTLTDVPTRACPSGHERWMASPDDSSHLLLELQDRLPHASRRTPCPSCGGRESTPSGIGVFELDVDLPSGSTMGFRLDAPARTCGACGTQQLDPERVDGDDIAEAVVAAYEDGALKR